MGLSDFFNTHTEEFEIKKNEREEKRQTKTKLKVAKKNLKEMTEDRDLYRDKYISLLEEKGEGFNQYLFWEEKAKSTEAEEKELRKELADYKKDFRDYNTIIGKCFTKESITSLTRCETFDDFMVYILGIYFTDKNLPLKGIQDTCKKLNITKNMIRKESEFLYRDLGVEKWEID